LLQDKDLLGKVVTDTVSNIEKKQARTYEELQAEQMEAEEVCRNFHLQHAVCTATGLTANAASSACHFQHARNMLCKKIASSMAQ